VRQFVKVVVTILVAGLALAAMTSSARADGGWQPLNTPRGAVLARVTYYGDYYDSGEHYCADGRIYEPGGWFIALGPSMLAEARAKSGQLWPTVLLTTMDGREYVLPVEDTGGWAAGRELEADLPDSTWMEISGEPPGAGLFFAEIDVWPGLYVEPELTPAPTLSPTPPKPIATPTLSPVPTPTSELVVRRVMPTNRGLRPLSSAPLPEPTLPIILPFIFRALSWSELR
jgi:hypothetical protein